MATATTAAAEQNLVDGFARVVESPALVAVAVSVVALTLLIVLIELIGKTSSKFRSIAHISAGFYLLILIVGNLSASLLFLIPFINGMIDSGRYAGHAALAAVAGVFSFEGILGNTNITVFNKGVLTLSDWISKARDSAIAATIEKDARHNDLVMHRLANTIAALPLQALNAHVTHIFDGGAVALLNDEAAAAGADPALYKALKLVGKNPKYARSLVSSS